MSDTAHVLSLDFSAHFYSLDFSAHVLLLDFSAHVLSLDFSAHFLSLDFSADLDLVTHSTGFSHWASFVILKMCHIKSNEYRTLEISCVITNVGCCQKRLYCSKCTFLKIKSWKYMVQKWDLWLKSFSCHQFMAEISFFS